MLFSSLVSNHIHKRDVEYEALIDSMRRLGSFISSTLSTNGYVERNAYASQLEELYATAAKAEKKYRKPVIIDSDITKNYRSTYLHFQKQVNEFESSVDAHNTEYLQGLIHEARNQIGKVEGHDLDDQQMLCILKDAYNHNVVAGAGTGKPQL